MEVCKKWKTFILVVTLVNSFLMNASLASTPYEPMMTGLNGFSVDAVFTVGESINGYIPPGILDGIAAFKSEDDTVRVLVNHELRDNLGYEYTLANGVILKGARISYFDFDAQSREILDAGVAFDTIVDRQGNVVIDADQVNEGDGNTNGLDRLCSSTGYSAGEHGFVENIYFAGEETSKFYGHPHGGSEWVLDVDNGVLYAAPDLGRGTWENVTAMRAPRGYVALLLGDDFAAAPLYLYVGKKDKIDDGSFLDRNGLVGGQMFVWVAENGEASPEDFNGTGNKIKGTFIEIQVQDITMAGVEGYDSEGYKDDLTLRDEATSTLGAFTFSRPEDLHTNPKNPREVVMASTGRGILFPSDNWGTIYTIKTKFMRRKGRLIPFAEINILHDCDDFGDFGVRNSDNLTWANNGLIYVQENRAVIPRRLFGAESGREASIWQIHPRRGDFTRIAEMDRSAVAPAGSTDNDPADLGDWESSGVLDVTKFFETDDKELLLIADVQAHSVRDGLIGGDSALVRGGQIIFLSTQDVHSQHDRRRSGPSRRYR